MRVKVLLVVTTVGVEGKVRSWEAPSDIRVHGLSSPRPVADHLRDITNSWIEPDLDGVAPFVHDEVPATRVVKRGAEGCAGWDGVGEDDAASCVEVGSRVAIGVRGLSTTIFILLEFCRVWDSEKTHPVCGWRHRSGGIVQFGVVCRVAWLWVFKLTPEVDRAPHTH